MYYLKTLGWIFLIVFFANHILPGIEVTDQTKLPHLGADLIFPVALAVLNSLIYAVLRVAKKDVSIFKIALFAIILNFAAYGVVKFFPFGIKISTLNGYLLISGVVALGSFFANFFEKKHSDSQYRMDPPQ